MDYRPTHLLNTVDKPGFISFCCGHKGRLKNLQRLLACVKKLNNAELVCADYSNTNISDSALLLERCDGMFTRSGALNQACAKASGDIIFFIDVDMVFTEAFGALILEKVKRGQAFFPMCFSLREGKPPVVQEHNGWWRSEGFGVCGFHKDDVPAWDERFIHWGGEDVELYKRCCLHMNVVRERCGLLFHMWHRRTAW